MRNDISYPIFLRDRDEWMISCDSQASLVYQIEATDVEGSEFDAWDSEGRPLSLQVINGKPAAMPTELPPDSEALRRAILRYAEVAGKAGGLEPQVHAYSPTDLFGLAEKHIASKRPTLVTKLRRWLGRR